MKFKTFEVGAFGTCCYPVFSETTRTLYLIDPGADARTIIAEAKKFPFETVEILLTHAHIDHISAVGEVAKALGVKHIRLAPEDRELYNSPLNCIPPYFPEHPSDLPETEDFPADAEYKAIPLPGHTPGGSGFLFGHGAEAALFCGDTIFLESVGRTDLPGGNFDTLSRSIREKILTLDDGLKLYPGHGPSTTVGHERRNNPYIDGNFNEL